MNKKQKKANTTKLHSRPLKKPLSINWALIRWKVWRGATYPFRILGNFLSRALTIYSVAIILVLIAIALWYYNKVELTDLIPNIITDLLGVALAVFIIDTMYRLRSNTERKKVLILKLGSKNNAVATESLHELEAEGWLFDGSLNQAFLISCNLDRNSFIGADLRRAMFSFGSLQETVWYEANLQGASLDHTNLSNATFCVNDEIQKADLTGTNLFSANLSGAKVTHEQLCKVSALFGATMPDGQRYDGRYNLPEEVERILKRLRDPNNPQEWANYYGVSLERYLEGQKWAQLNLSQMR